MKVLMTLESNYPPDKRVENEIEALISAGHEIDITCFGSRGQPSREEYHGANVIRIFPGLVTLKSSVGALKVPLYFNYWKRKIRKLLEQKEYDAVHIHDLPLAGPVSTLKKKFNFKTVLDLHENWPGLLAVSPYTRTMAGRILCNISDWEKYEKEYIRGADRVIVVIEEAKKRISPFTEDPGKITIVSNTINTTEFDRQEIKRSDRGEKVVFIYEGGITYHRGLQNIISALARTGTSNNGFELRIIGNGSYLPHLRRQVQDLGLNQKVRFYGWKPIGEVYKMLGEADVALIPHLRSNHSDNTIPHKLFHYIYSGLPVLASDCDPLKRIINETGSGIIYPDGNIDELTRVIENILNDPDHLKQYMNSKSWIVKKYNWKNDSERLINLYMNL